RPSAPVVASLKYELRSWSNQLANRGAPGHATTEGLRADRRVDHRQDLLRRLEAWPTVAHLSPARRGVRGQRDHPADRPAPATGARTGRGATGQGDVGRRPVAAPTGVSGPTGSRNRVRPGYTVVPCGCW